MGSPQKKNFGQSMESPYARHMSQYPSQTEGFVPNDFGGNGNRNCGPPTPSKQQYYGNNYYQNNSNQRRRGNNRYFNAQQGSNGGGGRGGGGGGNNMGGGIAGGGGGGYRNQNNYQGNYNDHQSNRYSNSGNRQQPYHGQKHNRSDGNSRHDYYHPSMVVDPWKDLIDRHNAIKNSQISVQSTAGNDSDHEPIGSSSPVTDPSAIADDSDRDTPATTSTPT